ncbi:MAG: hypothetical protein HC849_13860 [Oscillatoriales cyanobacterium RU_3_3]|nr:hypothetical protein [Microcoleus sp. SU_5_6]NJM61047.1 hypothetical protein [Oscillatoriales cyanobacterium RU_3_3]
MEARTAAGMLSELPIQELGEAGRYLLCLIIPNRCQTIPLTICQLKPIDPQTANFRHLLACQDDRTSDPRTV